MHELWLCKNILEIINQNFLGKQCTRIKKVYLEIGELVNVDKSSLVFSFEVIAKETLAKDAILEIIPVSAKAICDSCKQSVKIHHYGDSCQSCGSFTLTITQGEELRVKSMEVE